MELHEAGILDAELTDGIPMVWGEPTPSAACSSAPSAARASATCSRRACAPPPTTSTRTSQRSGAGTLSTYELAMQVNNNPMYGITPRLTSMALGYSVGRRSDLIQELDIPQFNIVAAPAYPRTTPEDREEMIEFETERVVA